MYHKTATKQFSMYKLQPGQPQQNMVQMVQKTQAENECNVRSPSELSEQDDEMNVDNDAEALGFNGLSICRHVVNATAGSIIHFTIKHNIHTSNV